MSAWIDFVNRWKDCHKCPLGDQRDRICLARGTIPADVVFIGEAPGEVEDSLGLPFTGPAGKLLDSIIMSALPPQSVTPVTFALTNLVACFPRQAKLEGINEPEASEIKACRPRLYEFIELANPKLIVLVGALAANYIGEHDARGRIASARVCEIIHPAATFPPRMAAAQAQMARQRAVVVLRNAVEDMLEEMSSGER